MVLNMCVNIENMHSLGNLCNNFSAFFHTYWIEMIFKQRATHSKFIKTGWNDWSPVFRKISTILLWTNQIMVVYICSLFMKLHRTYWATERVRGTYARRQQPIICSCLLCERLHCSSKNNTSNGMHFAPSHSRHNISIFQRKVGGIRFHSIAFMDRKRVAFSTFSNFAYYMALTKDMHTNISMIFYGYDTWIIWIW